MILILKCGILDRWLRYGMSARRKSTNSIDIESKDSVYRLVLPRKHEGIRPRLISYEQAKADLDVLDEGRCLAHLEVLDEPVPLVWGIS